MKIESKNIILLAGVVLLLNSYGTANADAANTSTPQQKSETKSTTHQKDGTLLLTPEQRLKNEEENVMEPFPG